MIAFDPLSTRERVRIVDLHPAVGDLQAEASEGLRRSPKALPCKYFYDALGARLFEAITELPEYYPTRTELGIMTRANALARMPLWSSLARGWVSRPRSS